MNGLDDLRVVDAKVNLCPYKPEQIEDWTPITLTGGDCDSYATAKMQELWLRGWPINWLRLAMCRVEPFKLVDKDTGITRDATDAERLHLVLLADLDGQTWVLDNRRPYPTEFQLLRYEWLRFQIAGTRLWEYA